MKRPALKAVLVVVAATVVAVLGAPGQATSLPDRRDYVHRTLDDVSASSPSNAWAFGTSFEPIGGPHGVVLHWNGNVWRVARPPIPSDGLFSGVATWGKKQAWLLGYSFEGYFVVHWNGSRWTRQWLPSGTNSSRIVVLSPINIWLAGGTTILHWNGHTWRRAHFPKPRGSYFGIDDVAVASAQSIWTVGQYQYPHSGSFTYIGHWNGKRWTWHPKSTDKVFGGGGLTDVTAARQRVFATGPDQGQVLGAATRWNRHTWQNMPTVPYTVSDLAAVAGNDVWAGGHRHNVDNSRSSDVMARWNGRSWHTVPFPRLQAGRARLNAVTAPTPRCAWAVGTAGIPRHTWPQMFFWNGTRWRRQAIPPTA